ncbi:MAG TPA: hypothetical protein VFR02_06695, partial [bacterium]|nr:hypothetical protein [bacterium]
MKSWMMAAVLAAAALAGGWWSHRALSREPLPLFLAVESPDELDAFHVGLFLSGAPGVFSPVTLTGPQAQALRDAFDRKDPGPAR